MKMVDLNSTIFSISTTESIVPAILDVDMTKLNT